MIKKFIFLGDSITDGERIKETENSQDKNHSMGHCYAYLISAEKWLKYPERHYEFLDRGVSGFGINDLYEHADEIIAEKPECISILIGINDCADILRRRDDAENFKTVYRKLLLQLTSRLPGVSLILCEPFCLPIGEVDKHYGQYLYAVTAARAAVEELATEFSAIFVPLQSIFDKAIKVREQTYWMWDGIHPTVSGHALIAREWNSAAKILFGEN